MSSYPCVYVQTPEISSFVQLVAFDNGYSWSWMERRKEIRNTTYKYLFFWPDKSICYSNESGRKGSILLSLEQAYIFLKTGALPAPKYREYTLGNNLLKIHPQTKIEIGCLTISKEQVEAIYSIFQGK